MAETQKTELNSLMIQLRQLESKRETMNKEQHDILEQINQKESHELKEQHDILEQINQKESHELKQEIRPTRAELVVNFVKEIEKAKQYFEFDEHLKQNCEKQDKDEFACFKRLVDGRVHRRYPKLDFKDIMEAVEGWWHGYVVVNPLRKLVYLMNTGYTLNEDPIYELREIEKEDYVFYKQNFVWKLFENYSANKVVVQSVPFEFTYDDVRDLLSGCGDVVSVVFDDSMSTWGKMAHATFKDSVSAKIAPILMTRMCYLVLPYLESSLEPDLPSSSEYNEAMKKYEEIRNLTSDGAFARLKDMPFVDYV